MQGFSSPSLADEAATYTTSADVMQPGSASQGGTESYAKKFAGTAGPEHFRLLPFPSSEKGLQLSSVGIGTYLGPETDKADEEYEAAVTRCLEVGINVIDCAINYRNMRSERAIGRALRRLFETGRVTREEVVVCTKGGFIAFEEMLPQHPGKWIEENFVKPGLMEWSEFIAGCHCMAPKYLEDQIERSRKNLGLESIDVYYIHNPETQLSVLSAKEFDEKIRLAFQKLEEACEKGTIGVYGVATWTGLRVRPGAREHISLENLVRVARDVGGENHHFRVIQAPYNLAMTEAASGVSQIVKGHQMSLFKAAKELGIYVVASASLMQAQLSKGLPAHVRSAFGDLGESATNAHRALQFVRTTPHVGTALVGMRQMSNVNENAALIVNHSASYRNYITNTLPE